LRHGAWRLPWFVVVVAVCVALSTGLAPFWLPTLGTLLVVEEAPMAVDAALVLDGSGTDVLDGVETWRRSGLVRDVVVVEAPVRSHAIVAYWSDFVAWGFARPAPIPHDHLTVVRSPSLVPGEQTRAALPELRRLGARSVMVPGGGLGSRLVSREVESVLGPAGITSRITRVGAARRDPARWYLDPEDRRAVLDFWLQMALPFLSGYVAEDS
jgi:hypothetical protein